MSDMVRCDCGRLTENVFGMCDVCAGSRDFDFARDVVERLNRLLGENPAGARAVLDSGFVDVVNREYRQGLGPVVAVCGADGSIRGFEMFVGGAVEDDDELAALKASVESGECVIGHV